MQGFISKHTQKCLEEMVKLFKANLENMMKRQTLNDESDESFAFYRNYFLRLEELWIQIIQLMWETIKVVELLHVVYHVIYYYSIVSTGMKLHLAMQILPSTNLKRDSVKGNVVGQKFLNKLPALLKFMFPLIHRWLLILLNHKLLIMFLIPSIQRLLLILLSHRLLVLPK